MNSTQSYAGRIAGCREPASAGSEALAFARFAEHEALAGAWRRLGLVAELPTQSYWFVAALACTLLAQAIVAVFVVPGAEGGFAALLAVCRRPGYFARWRTLGAAELSEPDDALCATPAAARQLAEVIARQSRALSLERVPARSELLPALGAAMKGKGWVSVRPGVASPTITLDPGWQNPEARFNSGRRSDFRRYARRAAALGAVTYEMLSPPPEQFDALFDEAIGVEARSWKSAAGTALGVDRGKEEFFRRYFHAACARGEFRLAVMRIDGQAVAIQMGIESLGGYWLFKIGFDEGFGRCSPGTLLMLHAIGWAARRELRAFELLGNVEPWIAEFWTQERHDCVRVRTYPYSARGAVAFAMDCLVWLRARLIRRAG